MNARQATGSHCIPWELLLGKIVPYLCKLVGANKALIQSIFFHFDILDIMAHTNIPGCT